VYIHGGAFSGGGSSCEVYEGEDIAQQDVVYVSINYRLGIFGFFANSDLVAEDENNSSGNYGLMDMIKALEWVQDNIATFGGDKDNVTIMGQSAGASSVNYLTVSPAAKGLFKRAVACSYDDVNGAQALVSYVNTIEERVATNDEITKDYTLEQLRAMSTDEISALLSGSSGGGGGNGGMSEGGSGMPEGGSGMPEGGSGMPDMDMSDFGSGSGGGTSVDCGGPCIDGYIVTQTYGDALKKGALGDIDLMTGFVDNEANDGATGFTAITLDRGLFLSDHDETFTATESLVATQNAIAKARSLTNDSGSTYIYIFSKIMPGSANNYAFHTSDIPYFLNHFTSLRADNWTDADKTVGATASAYLVNFARTGNPNGDGLTTWTECTGNYTYLDINETCTSKTIDSSKISSISAYLKASSKVRYPEFY
jgi:para-nitrobenzyl esterase